MNDTAEEKALKRQQLNDEFIDNVTLHGYRYLFTRNKWRRIIWWIFFLGAFAFAIFMFYGALQDFFDYKSVSVTEYDYEVESLDFPALTFCFDKPYTKLKRKKFSFMDDDFYTIMQKEVYTGKKHRDKLSNKLEKYIKTFENKNISYKKLYDLISINLHDIMSDNVSNTFHDPPCIFNTKKCKRIDFTTTMNSENLNIPCMQFNGYALNSTSKRQVHINDNRWFWTYINVHDALSMDKRDEGANGITLHVHHREAPFHERFSTEIRLQTGYLTSISIDELQMIKLLPPPHGKCGSKKLKILKNYPYTFEACRVDCTLERFYENCGCIGFEFKAYIGNLSVCGIKERIECFATNRYKQGTEDYKTCRKSCIQNCVHYKYPLRVEATNLVTKRQINKVLKHTGWKMSKEDVGEYLRLHFYMGSSNQTSTFVERENVVGVRIGYRRINKRREIATPSITLTSLVGTVGGSIGLGLGFSLLTLVEFVLFLIDHICLLIPSKRTNKVL